MDFDIYVFEHDLVTEMWMELWSIRMIRYVPNQNESPSDISLGEKEKAIKLSHFLIFESFIEFWLRCHQKERWNFEISLSKKKMVNSPGLESIKAFLWPRIEKQKHRALIWNLKCFAFYFVVCDTLLLTLNGVKCQV